MRLVEPDNFEELLDRNESFEDHGDGRRLYLERLQ